MIYAALHPDRCGGGQLFNIADDEAPCTYGALWPRLAEWFGLVGAGPVEEDSKALGGDENTLGAGELPRDAGALLTPGAYVEKHRDVFAQRGCEKAVDGGVGAGSRQLDSVGFWLTFDRQLSLDKIKKTGFDVKRDPVQGWFESFEMFRKAGLVL